MNKNNDKQRTTHEHYWEPKKNIWTNQGKTNENHRKTNEKPKKEQWKTMENQRQFCQHSKLLFWQVLLAPVFLSFPSSMGKEIRDNFERKRKPLRCLGGWVFKKTRKYAVNCIVSCICASNGVIFLFAVIGVPFWRKTRCTERT